MYYKRSPHNTDIHCMLSEYVVHNVIDDIIKVTGYRNGRGQRSKWNNSQWPHVLGYSRKTRKISQEARHIEKQSVFVFFLLKLDVPYKSMSVYL